MPRTIFCKPRARAIDSPLHASYVELRADEPSELVAEETDPKTIIDEEVPQHLDGRGKYSLPVPGLRESLKVAELESLAALGIGAQDLLEDDESEECLNVPIPSERRRIPPEAYAAEDDIANPQTVIQDVLVLYVCVFDFLLSPVAFALAFFNWIPAAYIFTAAHAAAVAIIDFILFERLAAWVHTLTGSEAARYKIVVEVMRQKKHSFVRRLTLGISVPRRWFYAFLGILFRYDKDTDAIAAGLSWSISDDERHHDAYMQLWSRVPVVGHWAGTLGLPVTLTLAYVLIGVIQQPSAFLYYYRYKLLPYLASWPNKSPRTPEALKVAAFARYNVWVWFGHLGDLGGLGLAPELARRLAGADAIDYEQWLPIEIAKGYQKVYGVIRFTFVTFYEDCLELHLQITQLMICWSHLGENSGGLARYGQLTTIAIHFVCLLHSLRQGILFVRHAIDHGLAWRYVRLYGKYVVLVLIVLVCEVARFVGLFTCPSHALLILPSPSCLDFGD